MTAIKNAIYFAIFFVAAAMAGRDADAQATVQIPVTGKTADGKYNTYALTGDLTDINYFSGNTVYRSGDLLKSLPYVDTKDIKSGQYVCEFVCKDKQGHIVGQNPTNKQIPR